MKPKVSNFQDTRAVTRLINAGTNGLNDRDVKFVKYKKACGITALVQMHRVEITPTGDIVDVESPSAFFQTPDPDSSPHGGE